MIHMILVWAITLAVILGYRTKINTGLFAMVFAYLIGCYGLNISTKDLIASWPTSTMFVILSVSLFYNFATINGTLEKVSSALLYSCRRFPGILPFALFGVAALLSIMGATYFTILAFMAPITFAICEEAKMGKMTGAVAVNCGALAGGNFPTASLGVIFRGLMDSAYLQNPNVRPVDSFRTELIICGYSIVFSTLLIACFRYGFSENRQLGEGIQFKKPEPFDERQKITLALMLCMMALVLSFPLAKLVMPQNETIQYLAGQMDVGLVAICFAVIALLLKLAPEQEVVARVPWSTILMIAGTGMLISVAIHAGTIQALAEWISVFVPDCLIPLALNLASAFMGFFSSATGVVTPALFPVIPALSETTGANASMLFICTVLGVQSSSISPFSSGGSLILGTCDSEEEKNRLFQQLLFRAIPVCVLSSAAYSLMIAIVF